MSLRAKRHDGTGGPVVCAVLGQNLRRVDFQKKKKVAVRSFTADGGLMQPTGSVKTTPPQSPFSQCESLQGILVQVKK